MLKCGENCNFLELFCIYPLFSGWDTLSFSHLAFCRLGLIYTPEYSRLTLIRAISEERQ